MRIVDLHQFKGPVLYCGRDMPGKRLLGSLLSNPYKVGKHPDPLGGFRKHLWFFIRQRDERLMRKMRQITEDSILGCWCVDLEGDAIFTEPERCHTQIIWKAWKWLKAQGTI